MATENREKGYTPLHLAVIKGNLDEVRQLIDIEKADISAITSEGYLPLHFAVIGNNLEMVKLCINEKININQKAIDRDEVVLRKFTPLHLAASLGNLSVVELLILKGAAIEETTDQGWTALHLAAGNGRAEVTQYLIQRGADTKAKDMNDKSPFFLATQEGYYNLGSAMAKMGACINQLKNISGRSRSKSVLSNSGSPIHQKLKHVRQISHPDSLSPREDKDIQNAVYKKT